MTPTSRNPTSNTANPTTPTSDQGAKRNGRLGAADLPNLLPQHSALIEGSAISRDVALARGYRSITVKAELARLGFTAPQQGVPGLLVPIWTVTGENASAQYRPDNPRYRDGRAIKYETPAGTRTMLDVPPSVRPRLGNPSLPLWVTEGVRKADSGASAGLCCVALLGVWNWRGTNDHGGKVALPEWENVALNEREVFVAYDSDVMLNPAVHAALARLGAFLTRRGARVRYVYLPPGDGGTKQGLDDFLAAGHGVADLLAYASAELRNPPAGDDDPDPAALYAVRDGAIHHRKRERDGDVWLPLCTFAACVTEEVVADDGASERSELLIEGSTSDGRPLPPVRVPVGRFGAMDWPLQLWGMRAVVVAGIGAKDKLREAIQRLSGDVPRRREYRHPGWRKIDGETWAYLHAGGAIGPAGPIEGVSVNLGGAASRLILPDPPEGDALRRAVRASVAVLDVAPDRITAPLLGIAYRAPLNEVAYADTAGFVVGPTGEKKSELAALLMQHVGSGFDRKHLPAQWSSTPNALERLAFDFKDAPVVIDDFAPTGSAHDVARYHATADRVLRGAGNAAGRGRMAADGSARPDYPPRGIVVGTGEDVPKGHSARARAVLVEVAPGDVNLPRLTDCQAAGRRGDLAAATAGYVRWLAPRLDDFRDQMPATQAALREAAWRDGAHARTPEAVANLAAGWRTFLRFAVEVDALSQGEAEGIWARAWGALMAVGADQRGHHEGEAPAARFLALLAAAIEAGQAHVCGPDGDAPAAPMAWGWRGATVGGTDHERHEWRPGGVLVGWLDGDDLYLVLDAAYAAAQRIGQSAGGGLTVQPKTLTKRLHEAGLLRSTEEERGKLTVRRSFAGVRRNYVHLAASTLSQEEPAQSAQTDHADPGTPSHRAESDATGPVTGAGPLSPDPKSAQGKGPERPPEQDHGPVGPIFSTGQPCPLSRQNGQDRSCVECGSPLPPHRTYRCDACTQKEAA